MGQAKIQAGNFKLIHIVEIQKYEELADKLESLLKKNATTKHPAYPYLNYELSQIKDFISNLKPHRSIRALNFIGTAWKWIAGSPDNEDFEMIQNKINNVLINNNKQVIVNAAYNERINKLSSVTNEILKLLRKDNKLSDQIVFNIHYKLKIIKEDLTNIRYAIHWAKSGIINSMILSKTEIKVTTDTLDKENLPYNTPEEALDFANLKIITNGSCLFYVINIPLTREENYEKLLIKPIKRNGYINELSYNNILRNKNNIYGIKNTCKTINHLTICKENDLVDITRSSCIPNLLKSLDSSCNKINNQHIPTIDEISEGILLLNKFNGSIMIEDTPQNLKGTFLVKFHNISLSINNKLFVSKEESTLQILPAILQPNPTEEKYLELLSLESIREFQINNTNQITLLQTEKKIHQTVSYGLIAIIVIILLGLLAFRMIKRNKMKIIIEQKPQDSEIHTTQMEHKPQENMDNELEMKKIPCSLPIPIPKPKSKIRTLYDTSFL